VVAKIFSITRVEEKTLEVKEGKWGIRDEIEEVLFSIRTVRRYRALRKSSQGGIDRPGC